VKTKNDATYSLFDSHTMSNHGLSPSLRGAFEVHLIARTMDALEGALQKVPPSASRPRLGEARTHYGLHPSQPMVTYWDSGVADDVIERARATAEAIGGIVRIKVEGTTFNAGTPLGVLPDDSCYWEIHAKIVGGDWDQAAAICAPFGVHLFWNGTKESARAITNLRRYRVSFSDAFKDQKRLEEALLAAGMTLEEVHFEYGILDTAPELDEGWLYARAGHKTEFLTHVPVPVPVQ
jgi:hypothetical protein